MNVEILHKNEYKIFTLGSPANTCGRNRGLPNQAIFVRNTKVSIYIHAIWVHEFHRLATYIKYNTNGLSNICVMPTIENFYNKVPTVHRVKTLQVIIIIWY